MTESVLVYSALKDWMDFIADLDKVIDSLREEEELYFGWSMASQRAARWLDMYMETGDAKGAVRAIYNCSEKNLASRASQLKAKYAFEIDQQLRMRFISDSIKMYNIVKGLATCSSSETVKLNAARDLLDRGGFKPDDVVRVQEEHMTRDQMEAKAIALRKQIIETLSPEEVAAAIKAIPSESADKQLDTTG